MSGIVVVLFYLSAIALTGMAIHTAKAMSRSTCRCMRWCLILIAIGLVGLVMLVHYDITGSLRLVCVLPIFWGLTGWLFFDRYRPHDDIEHFKQRARSLLASLLMWISSLRSREESR